MLTVLTVITLLQVNVTQLYGLPVALLRSPLAKAVAENATAEDAAWWSDWLDGLSKSGRFDMTILMLDQKAKASIAEMFNTLGAHLEGKGETTAKLAKVRKLES